MLTGSRRAAALLRSAAEVARARSGRHVHWFRRVADDPFSGASLYACRCGEVRPGF